LTKRIENEMLNVTIKPSQNKEITDKFYILIEHIQKEWDLLAAKKTDARFKKLTR
jgi:hypothetical protein